MTFGSKVFRKRSKINASDENEASGDKKRKTLAKENLLSNNNNHNNNSHHTNNVDKPVYVVSRKWSSLYKSEDWWAVWIGLIIFGLSLPTYFGIYSLGWVPAAKPWLNITQALSTKTTLFTPWVGLAASFVFLTILLVPVTRFNVIKSKDWFKGFVVIFSISWTIWILSNYSPIVKAIGSPEVGYIIALVVGIVIANLTRLPSWLKNSARGELFIKTAIVLLGAKILFTTFVTSAPSILAAAFLSFPVVWIIAFLISRKMGLDRNFAATLSSGVGVCGVSASIATSAAIEAPAIYSTVISSIIVIFSAIEIILMPFVGAYFFPTHSTAAGVWMGLSVKTDGAASASASVVDSLLKAKGSALNSAVITKVMIDIWIGVISFVLATIWVYKVTNKQKTTNTNTKVSPKVLWYRFPKFVLGYIATSLILSAIAFTYPSIAAGAKAVAPISTYGTEPLRTMFFSFTFLAIGLNTQFSRFREISLKTPIIVYGISLFIAIIWGGIISYLFFGS